MDEQEVAHRILDYLEELGTSLANMAPDAQRIAMQAIYADAVKYLVTILGTVLVSIILTYAAKKLIDYSKVPSYDEFMVCFGGIGIVTAYIVCIIIAGNSLTVLLQILVAPEYMALRKIVGIFTGADN